MECNNMYQFNKENINSNNIYIYIQDNENILKINNIQVVSEYSISPNFITETELITLM